MTTPRLLALMLPRPRHPRALKLLVGGRAPRLAPAAHFEPDAADDRGDDGCGSKAVSMPSLCVAGRGFPASHLLPACLLEAN